MKTFEGLWDELAAKSAQGAPDSRTVELLTAGVHAIGKKVVEEAAEAWMAAEYEGADRTAEEIAQLIYHAQVLMLPRACGWRTLPTSVTASAAPMPVPSPALPMPQESDHASCRHSHKGVSPRPPPRCCGRPVTASAAMRRI